MTVSGLAAAAWMHVGRPNTKNACLGTVWQAYGSPHTVGRLPGHTFATAIEAYNYTTKRHTDRNPPRGAAVWFGSCRGPRYAGDKHWQDGDVCVSLGGGNVGGTDTPWGQIGQLTIAGREAETGRVYLGWTEDIFGNDIDLGATPANLIAAPTGTATITPTPEQEVDEMSFAIVPDDQSDTRWVVSLTTGRWTRIATPDHETLLTRIRDNKGVDKMLEVELKIGASYLGVVNGNPVDASAITGAVATALKNASVNIDQATIEKAVTDGIASQTAALTKAINDDAARRAAA